MSKAEQFCKEHGRIGYISALGGFEVHGYEYGINDYVYAVSNAWNGKKTYHRLKVNYTKKGDVYVVCRGTRLYFRDSVRDVETA